MQLGTKVYSSFPNKGPARKAWSALEEKAGKGKLYKISYDRNRKVWIGCYTKEMHGIIYWPRIPNHKILE